MDEDSLFMQVKKKKKKKEKKKAKCGFTSVTPYKSHILQNHTLPDFILQPKSSIRHQDKLTKKNTVLVT